MSHYYDTSGNPVYEVPKASGKGMKETTLREARLLNLVPSVTTIISEAASPGLTQYYYDQILEAVLSTDLKKPDGSNLDQITIWKQQLIVDAKQHAAIAAKKGNEIHDALEDYYSPKVKENKMLDFVLPVTEFLNKKFGFGFISEKSFSHNNGFGGKVDLHAPNLIIDFKTKPDKAFEKGLTQYDNHYMQLAAYRLGLQLPDAECYNLFISNETPGKFKLLPEVWNPEEEQKVQKGEKMFLALLQYHQLKTGHVVNKKLFGKSDEKTKA